VNPVQILSQSLDFKIGNFTLYTSYLQAGAIVVLLFLLVLSMALFRRHLMSWSLKGALFGIFFGFLLALILEGFLIIAGKTALTEILGWKNAPKPISVLLDSGRTKLIQVLGISEEIPASVAKENMSAEEFIGVFQSLNPQESSKVRKMICEP